jgi:hypothetical protein
VGVVDRRGSRARVELQAEPERARFEVGATRPSGPWSAAEQVDVKVQGTIEVSDGKGDERFVVSRLTRLGLDGDLAWKTRYRGVDVRAPY